MCGLPGYGPGDLIDMAFDGDRVTITYDAGIDRPLRLTQDEALALVVALRMLAQVPGGAQPGGGRAGPGQDRVGGRGRGGRAAGGGPAAGHRRRPSGSAELQGAVQRRHALRLTYYTATRDELTERVVDPMRVLRGRRPRLPGGVVPPGRGGAAVPGRPDRAAAPSWTSRPPRRRDAQPHRRQRRACSRPSAGAAADHAADRPLGPLDHRVLPVRAGGRGDARTAGWSRCAPRTWPGPAGWCSGSGRR